MSKGVHIRSVCIYKTKWYIEFCSDVYGCWAHNYIYRHCPWINIIMWLHVHDLYYIIIVFADGLHAATSIWPTHVYSYSHKHCRRLPLWLVLVTLTGLHVAIYRLHKSFSIYSIGLPLKALICINFTLVIQYLLQMTLLSHNAISAVVTYS